MILNTVSVQREGATHTQLQQHYDWQSKQLHKQLRVYFGSTTIFDNSDSSIINIDTHINNATNTTDIKGN